MVPPTFKDSYLFKAKHNSVLDWTNDSWSPDVPPARDVFVWRVMIDKVPTDDKLIEMRCRFLLCAIFAIIMLNQPSNCSLNSLMLFKYGVGLPISSVLLCNLHLLEIFRSFATNHGHINAKGSYFYLSKHFQCYHKQIKIQWWEDYLQCSFRWQQDKEVLTCLYLWLWSTDTLHIRHVAVSDTCRVWHRQI